MSLGVTALLSMAIIMMMVAGEMPATSNVMPLIGAFVQVAISAMSLQANTTSV